MGDFFIIFGISLSIICIFRCFYDMILMKNKFKNVNVSIHVKYNNEFLYEAVEMERTLNHIKDKYLLNADVIFENNT